MGGNMGGLCVHRAIQGQGQPFRIHGLAIGIEHMKLTIVLRNRHGECDVRRDGQIMSAATDHFQTCGLRDPGQTLLQQNVVGSDQNPQPGLFWIPLQQPVPIAIFEIDDVMRA